MSVRPEMPTEAPLSGLVVFESVRRDRAEIGLARALAERCHRASLVDPAKIVLPMLDRMYKKFDPGTAPSCSPRRYR